MRIKEASLKSGISIDTLRFYEKLELVKPYREKGKRVYSDYDIQRLYQIQLLKDATFTLSEIKYFTELDEKFEDMTDIENMNTIDYNGLMRLLEKKERIIQEKLEGLLKAEKMIRKMQVKIISLERINDDN